MKSYKEILENLQTSIDGLEEQGITVKALNDSLDELQRHSSNIERVEEDIDAIREEVLEPVRKKLDENARAGRFSVYGFYLGAVGLIAAVLSLYFTNQVNLDGRLADIESKLGVEAPLELLDDHVELRLYRPTTIIHHNNRQYALELYDVDQIIYEDGPKIAVGFRLYMDGRRVNWDKAREIMKVLEETPKPESNYGPRGILAIEGDILLFFESEKFSVTKIKSEDPNGREFGDEMDAVYISRIDNTEAEKSEPQQ